MESDAALISNPTSPPSRNARKHNTIAGAATQTSKRGKPIAIHKIASAFTAYLLVDLSIGIFLSAGFPLSTGSTHFRRKLMSPRARIYTNRPVGVGETRRRVTRSRSGVVLTCPPC